MPMCTHIRAPEQNRAYWVLIHLWRFLSEVIFLAFVLSGRSILFLILVCPFDGWIQAMLIIAYFTQQLWRANPVRLLTVIYGDSHFCTQIMVDQIHVFSQVWGRASEIPHSKQEGHWQVAHYCTTISCAPASSDLGAFLSHWSTAPVMGHIPTPPPHSSTSHSPACILAAVSRTALQITLTEFSVPFVKGSVTSSLCYSLCQGPCSPWCLCV